MARTYSRYISRIKVDEEYLRKQDSVDARYGVVQKGSKVIYTKKGYGASHQKASSKIAEWRDSQPISDIDLLREFDSLLSEGNYPWYIWKVKFEKGESRTIKVNYMVPSGVARGGEYRYVKYLLSTGAGWKDKINKAVIDVKFFNVKPARVETINPANYTFDKKAKTIHWTFEDLEPTVGNDIYIQYYSSKERRKWENYKRKIAGRSAG